MDRICRICLFNCQSKTHQLGQTLKLTTESVHYESLMFIEQWPPGSLYVTCMISMEGTELDLASTSWIFNSLIKNSIIFTKIYLSNNFILVQGLKKVSSFCSAFEFSWLSHWQLFKMEFSGNCQLGLILFLGPVLIKKFTTVIVAVS